MSRMSILMSMLSGWPRRLAAAVCLFAAAATVVLGHHPHAGRQQILVATRTLAAGTALGSDDIKVISWPDDAPPSTAIGAPQQAVGHRTAVALARGTPIESNLLLDTRLATALAEGHVAMTVRLEGTASADLLQAGSYVDLYALDADSSVLIDGKSIAPNDPARPAASRVEILSVLAPAERTSTDASPTLVISASRTAAAQLSAHTRATFLATLVAPP